MFVSQYMQNNAQKLRTNATEAEKFVWQKLRKKQFGYKFTRQYVLFNKYIVDFICMEKRLIIELDGGQHCENQQDIQRDKELSASGYKILRLWNNEVFTNWEACHNKIVEYLS